MTKKLRKNKREESPEVKRLRHAHKVANRAKTGNERSRAYRLLGMIVKETPAPQIEKYSVEDFLSDLGSLEE